MKLLGALIALLILVLIVVEANKWALCESYMEAHLDGLMGR